MQNQATWFSTLMVKGVTHDQIQALDGQKVTVTYEVWGPTADRTAREITGTQTITGELHYAVPVELEDTGSYVLHIIPLAGGPATRILPYDVTVIAPLAKSKSSGALKHTCGGPAFGKKTPGCPRCDELIAGAAPVKWGWTEGHKSQADRDRQRSEDMKAHFASDRHNNRNNPNWCGNVCTAYEW